MNDTDTMTINKPLLRAIRDWVLANPRHHDMTSWFTDRSDDGPQTNPVTVLRRNDMTCKDLITPGINGCATTGCIAGIALLLTEHTFEDDWMRLSIGSEQQASDVIQAAAAVELGLNIAQSRRLFFSHEWPEPFKSDILLSLVVSEDYDDGDDPFITDWELHASTTAARIDHFIATEGAE
jgi:hypothetical protein